jgi:hypothetical protein
MHKFLANAGIVPSQTQTYALADIEAALEQAHGDPVTVRCRGGAINEIWYYFNIAGSLQSGKFIAAGPGRSTFNVTHHSRKAYKITRWPEVQLPLQRNQVPTEACPGRAYSDDNHRFPRAHSARHSLCRPR